MKINIPNVRTHDESAGRIETMAALTRLLNSFSGINIIERGNSSIPSKVKFSVKITHENIPYIIKFFGDCFRIFGIENKEEKMIPGMMHIKPDKESLRKAIAKLSFERKTMFESNSHSIAFLMDAKRTYLIVLGDIIGALSCWATRQSPYVCPDNLEYVLKEADRIMKGDYVWEKFSDMYMGYFDFISLEKYLAERLEQIPEFVAWNERKNGNQAPFGISSRFDGARDPDDDFIDLGALYRNIVGQVMTEAEDFRIFNEKFDREHDYKEPTGKDKPIIISDSSTYDGQEVKKDGSLVSVSSTKIPRQILERIVRFKLEQRH